MITHATKNPPYFAPWIAGDALMTLCPEGVVHIAQALTQAKNRMFPGAMNQKQANADGLANFDVLISVWMHRRQRRCQSPFYPIYSRPDLWPILPDDWPSLTIRLVQKMADNWRQSHGPTWDAYGILSDPGARAEYNRVWLNAMIGAHYANTRIDVGPRVFPAKKVSQ